MAGVTAHSSAIANSANARILVTLMSVLASQTTMNKHITSNSATAVTVITPLKAIFGATTNPAMDLSKASGEPPLSASALSLVCTLGTWSAGLSHNQRYQAQGSNRIGPSDSPEGNRNQTCERDEGQVAADRGLHCISSQRRTGRQRGQLALLPREHRHRNRCHDQYDNPEIARPHFTMSEQRQRCDERYVRCQPEQKASRDSG